MCCRFITDCQRQNFENRLTSGEVLDKSLVCCCLTDGADDIGSHGNGARRHYDVTVSYGENLSRFRSLQVVRKLSRKPPQAITEAVGVVLPLFIIFTARRYMLARYRAMLSSSVRHKPVLRRNDLMKCKLVLAWRLRSIFPTLFHKEIWLPPKIRVLPSGTLIRPKLRTWKISPRQVDRVVNKTRRRRRRSSLLTTPMRRSTHRGCLLQVLLRFVVDLLYTLFLQLRV